jgi:hypothetical protein
LKNVPADMAIARSVCLRVLVRIAGVTLLIAAGVGVIACPQHPGAPSSPEPALLGAQPRLDFLADGGVPNLDAGFNRFMVWVSTDATAEEVKVSCDGVDCPLVSSRARPGAERGVVAVVIDGSGSNSVGPDVCTGCPTDPDGGRVAATKAFFTRLLTNAPLWRAALFDFGPNGNAGFLSTRFIAGYSSVPDDLVAGADLLVGNGGTYIYDAIWDVAPTVAGERLFIDGGIDTPMHLLLVTDGEDTNSTITLPKAVGQAAQLGVMVDSIGYGHSDGGPIPLLAGKAFRDLRLIASATGGFSNIEQTWQLTSTLETIADAYLHGVIELELSLPDGATRVSGHVSVKGRDVPFAF